MALGFWINNKNCYGCKTCSIACKSEKQLDFGVLLREVSTTVQADPQAISFVSMSCNHCEDPACLANCPVQAYTKLDNGIVVQDHELCIGCQTCVNLCPYSAPSFDAQESKTFKCDMCYERQEAGQLPACVQACPGANLAAGEMSELEGSHTADVVSESATGVNPNFVITSDPLLAVSPDVAFTDWKAAKQ